MRGKVQWTFTERLLGFPESVGAAWQSARNPNIFEGARSYGTVAAPFLAGFAFASIPILISLDDPPPWAEGAIFFFVLATIAFVYSLQFSGWIQQYVAAPSVRLDWRREAVVDEAAYMEERRSTLRTSASQWPT